MAAELQLLFIASKYSFDSDDSIALHELVQNQHIDWDFFFSLAHRHKVFPLVWHNISTTIYSVIPERNIIDQKALIRKHTMHCMAIVGQLFSVSDLFNTHDIIHVPYKGPVLACYLFHDFNMRSYGDLDILVSAVDVQQVYALLAANGYSPEVVIPLEQLSAYVSVEDNLTFVSDRGVPIEIHWELSGRYLAKPLGFDYISPNLGSMTILDRIFPVFSPEALLVYLCLHGTKHCWNQLDLIVCLAELILKEAEIAWELVFQMATKHECHRMVHVGLLLVQKVYSVHLPDEVQAKVDEDRKAWYLCSLIFEALLESAAKENNKLKGEQDARFSTFRLSVRDSHLDAVRYLLRMTFCPSKSEWMAFQLPSWLTFGYWLARPLRIFWSAIAGTFAGKWSNLH